MTSEAEIKAAIRLAHGRRLDLRLFNNPVGEAWTGKAVHEDCGRVVIFHPRRIEYGLCPGSCDLIGFRTVEIIPSMVGRRVALFTGIEVKSESGRCDADQINFIEYVRRAGGIAGTARSAEEAEALLVNGLCSIATGRNHYND